MATQIPERIYEVERDIFAARYDLGNNHLEVYVNLGDEPYMQRVNPLSINELSINYAFLNDDRVTLPPHSGIWIRMPKDS